MMNFILVYRVGDPSVAICRRFIVSVKQISAQELCIVARHASVINYCLFKANFDKKLTKPIVGRGKLHQIATHSNTLHI
jgi:hypothetical protein